LEVSALKYQGGIGLHGRSPLLRLQSDERLIALLRRGNTGAFEVLVSRYESRLLAFCRHMLRSREDAEDVMQEVMTAAFNAIVADDRPINVRPWLYRIARNRSLNHMRKAQAIGVDSMDHHLSEHGTTTADKVHEREEFRMLVGDIHELPETQKTALVLREMDALSYEQISEAMETTVSSVKSLLVRARVSLAEAAEARLLSCEEVRIELGEIAEGLRKKPTPLVRRHLKDCKRCATFRTQLKQTNKALAVLLPVGPLVVFKKLAFLHLGHSAGAGAGSTATAAGSTASAGAGAVIGASGVFGGGSIVSAGMGAVATKAAAGLAAAAIVTAGAVEVDHHHAAHHPAAPVAAALAPVAPSPIAPVQSYAEKPSTVAAARIRTHKAVHHAAVTQTTAVVSLPLTATVAAPTTATTTPVTTPTTTSPTSTTAPGRVQTETDPTILPPPTTPSPAPPLSTPTTPAAPTTPAPPVTPTAPVTTTVPVTTAPAPPTTAPTTPPATTPTSTPTTPVVTAPPDPITPTTPAGTTPTTPAPTPTPTATTPTPAPTQPAPPVTPGTTTVGTPPLTVTVP
jgi:RNA polymerase sigma factor (sigma-70 family)